MINQPSSAGDSSDESPTPRNVNFQAGQEASPRGAPLPTEKFRWDHKGGKGRFPRHIFSVLRLKLETTLETSLLPPKLNQIWKTTTGKLLAIISSYWAIWSWGLIESCRAASWGISIAAREIYPFIFKLRNCYKRYRLYTFRNYCGGFSYWNTHFWSTFLSPHMGCYRKNVILLKQVADNINRPGSA